MRYRRLDANGDMVFGNGLAAFWQNQPEAVAQAVLTRLRLFQGDWFLDNSEGTAWRTQVLGSNTLTTYDATIRARIVQTQGVTELVRYSSQRNGDTRALMVAATIDTAYGPAPISVTLSAPQ